MVKSMYAYVRDAWARPEKSYVKELLWNRMQEWRREGSVTRLERPTRIDRARSLGYKAKQGIVVVRVQVRRGGRRVSRYVRARRSARMGKNRSTPGKSIQRIAEERASSRYPNMEVLNSYWVGQDGKLKYYEVILVDGHHPVIQSDANLAWVGNPTHRGRAERGKTSAGRKGRGMRTRGRGTEKTRPSIRSHANQGK
ncbi:50S ribosomal protein L15e [Methanoregula sp.]|jgi:large subunit ribosomal protein L15e|uniref:50S ribosomal protein L15e n=1 Tax=Methanoregula sp. TaxID=2052170 RepID=UPI003C1ECFE6